MLQERPWHALSWLLFAPALLDAAYPDWHARLASWPQGQAPQRQTLAALASRLQQQTTPDWQDLQLRLARQTRLGRVAEQLLGWYLQAQGLLHAHGVQVRVPLANGGERTVGEFDFLLQQADGLLHWELATKFYLYAPLPAGSASAPDYFLGPNLADSLGAKMRKIMQRQLALGQQAALCSPPLLTQPVTAAQAYVRGWLFYPWCVPGVQDFSSIGAQDPAFTALCQSSGLAAQHCRGWWCRRSDLPALLAQWPAARLQNLPRLAWLAPACLPAAQVHSLPVAAQADSLLPAGERMPQLLALLLPVQTAAQDAGLWGEVARVFVAPDDWLAQAASR